jgi:peroxiredoxin
MPREPTVFASIIQKEELLMPNDTSGDSRPSNGGGRTGSRNWWSQGGAPSLHDYGDERTESEPLPAGTPAPDFTLKRTPDETMSLSDLRGRPAILAYYPADWSPVCGDQMALYNEMLPLFEEYNAQIVGISVDGAWCHKAYAENKNLHFPLLADFEPKGDIAKAYRAYRYEDGVSERALFVLDEEGFIRWSYISPIMVNPGADGIFHALEQMRQDRESPRRPQEVQS